LTSKQPSRSISLFYAIDEIVQMGQEKFVKTFCQKYVQENLNSCVLSLHNRNEMNMTESTGACSADAPVETELEAVPIEASAVLSDERRYRFLCRISRGVDA
jgi:hypothetical protein